MGGFIATPWLPTGQFTVYSNDVDDVIGYSRVIPMFAPQPAKMQACKLLRNRQLLMRCARAPTVSSSIQNS